MASNNLSAWERMKEKTRAQQAERGIKQALSAAPKQIEAKEDAETFFSSVGQRENSVIGQMMTDSKMAYRAESRNDNSLWKQTEKDRAVFETQTADRLAELRQKLTTQTSVGDFESAIATQNEINRITNTRYKASPIAEKIQKDLQDKMRLQASIGDYEGMSEIYASDPLAKGRLGNILSGAVKQSAGTTGSAFAVTTEDMLDGGRVNVRGESMDKLSFDKNKALQYTQGVRDKTMALTQSGAADIEQAKQGLGTLGRLGVDTAAGLTQLGLDIGIGAATGLGAMPALAVRAFGGAADQAKMEGASVDQQVAYGLASAAVEVFAERLSSYNLILDKAHGKSPFSIDKFLDGVVAGIEDIATTPGGRALMNRVGSILASGMGEGFEEAISGIAEPFLSSGIYDKEFNMDIKEIGYQVLIGALTGAITGISGKSTLDYRVSKADESHGQVIRDTGMTPKIVRNALHTDKNSEAYKMADAIRSRKAPATNEELGKLNRLTLNQLIKEAEAVEKAQSADLGQPVSTKTATVLDRGTSAYMALGMKHIKRAEAKAKVVQKLIDGDEVSLDDMKILNLTDATYRAIFTQLTGVQFPEGMTNQDQLMNVAKTASEVRNNVAAEEAPIVPAAESVIAQPIAQDIAQVSDDAKPLSYEQFGEAYRRTEGADLSIDEPTMRSVYDSYLEHENQTVMESGAPVTRTQFRNNLRKTEAGAKMSDREIDRYFDSLRDSQTEAPEDLRHKLSKDVQDVIAALEKKLGIRIEVTDSIYVEKAGKFAEGESSVRSIRLALDTRGDLSYDEAVMQVLRHELTHQLKRAVSKDTYNAFAKYVREFDAEFYQKQYDSVKETYSKQFADTEDASVLNEQIDDEVIARCAEKLFEDEAFIRMVVGKNRTLAEKIHDIFEKLLKKLNLTGEAKKQLQTKRDLWAAMLTEAEENTKKGIKQGTEATVVDGKQYSYKSMSHDIREGTMYADLVKPQTLAMLDMKKSDIDKLFRQLNSLLKYMEPNLSILDYNEEYTKDDRPYHPYKQNSDPLYKISLDFSTMCTKRLLMQHIIERLQVMEQKPMSAARQMAIREKIKQYAEIEKGLQVACAMCYVESARLHSPEQVQHYLDDPGKIVAKHFSFKNKEFNAAVKEMQTEIKRKHGFNPNASKGQLSKAAKDEFRTRTDEMRENYKPTPEEQAIVDTANGLPVETYLTAENLTVLSKEHPEIYDAFTTYIRNATRSKSTQTPVPYYYGDSKSGDVTVSDKFIESMNDENGMRFSSWSDYMFKHVLDMMTAVIELSVRGSSMHGYTKFPQFVRVFGKTGMMFNLSGVADGMGLDENGKLIFSDSESVDIAEARKVRNLYPETAGVQCIGVSDDHIRKLMATDWIDYIIPYHVSGMSAALRRLAGIAGWSDYSDVQHAKPDPKAAKHGKEPVFSEFFVADNPGAGLNCMRKSAEKYKQLCAERGLIPKFNDFADDPNYWKLLIDRKMINQRTGALIFQKPVKPIFNFREIRKQVRQEVANYDPQREQRVFDYIVEHMDEVDSIAENVQAEMKAGAKGLKTKAEELGNEMTATAVNGDGQYSFADEHSEITDEEYLSAVERGDMETAQRMVDEAAKAAGYTVRGHHGTTNLFTVFDPSKSNIENDWGRGIYATTSAEDAEANYASEDGPDLTHRIERLAEMMENWEEYEDMDYDQRVEAARNQLSQGESRMLRVAFRMNNPVVVERGKGGTFFGYESEYDEETDEYSEPTGKLIDVIEMMKEIINEDYEWASWEVNHLDDIYEEAIDLGGMSAIQLQYAVDDALMDVSDEDGNLAGKEILREALERLGYDGIVDNSVAYKFGALSGKRGGGMTGVVEGTTHYIAFDSNQVKLTDPITYDNNRNVIPLSKRFDSSNEDIRYSFADEVAYIVGGSYNTTGKYWKPDFGQAEWNLWNRTVKREVTTTDQYVIDDSTKWLYAEEKGVRVFGLYSTNDPEDPTLLYASSGVNARTEYQDFTEFGEGKRDASVRKRKKTALDRVFDAIESWGSRADADLHLAENRQAEMGDVPVPAAQSGSDRGADPVEVQADPQFSLADDLTPEKRKAFIETFDAEFGEGAAEQMFKAHDQMARAAARAEKRAEKAAESKTAAETLAKEKSERDLTAFLMYHNRKLREQQRKYADDKAKLQKAKAEAVKEAVETTKLVERAKADIRVQATEMHLGKKAAEQKRTGNDKIADLKAEAADRLRVTKKAYRDEMSRAAKLQRNAAKHLLSDKKAAERRKNEIQTAQGPVNTIRQNPRERVKVEKMKALAQELRTRGRTAYRYFVNQAQEIDNFAKRQKGGIYASTLVNVLGGSSSTVESIFKNGLVDRSGNRIGESLKDVLLCMDATGKKVDEAKQALLQDYILHLHNIDRMSFVAKAKARLDAFEGNPENAWLVGLDVKDLAMLVAATDKETADAIFDKYGKIKKGKSGWTEADRQLAQEYASLLHNFLEAKDKAVFADENGNDVTADTSREIVAKYEKDNAWLIDKANGIFEWWDLFMRNWAVGDSLSLAEYETMHETYPHYAPTYRVDKAGPGGAVSVSGTAATVGKATKAAKGSTLEIVPIEDSFANIASKIVRLARVNELYMNIIDTAMLDEEGLFSDMAVFDWDWQSGEYGKALQLQAILNGKTEAAIEEATKTGLEKIGDDYKLTGWSHGRKYSAQISKELYQSIADTTGATDEQLKKLTKLGNTLTGPMKTAITGVNPFFAIRNLSRDIPSAIINSTGGKFPKYWAQAIAEMKSNSENWQAFKALGGTNAGYYNNEKGFVDAMAKGPGVVKTAIEGLGWINNVTEAATRFAEYLSTIDRMGDTYEARLQGIKNSAEVTVDFSRKGSYGKFINAWVPYWNPAVQGIDKMIRSVIESPDGSAVWKQATKTLGRAATQTILFEAILQAVLHALDRDDEWEKLSDRDKAAYYCIPLWDEHKFLKIAKNREWGAILGTPFMLLLEGLDGRQNPFENYVETALEPNFLPGAILRPREGGGFTSDVIGVSQALDLAYNEDFAGRTIIPYALQQGSKTEQYDSETSRLSVALGKLINFSPMQIDYIVKDYFGDFGELFTGLTAPGTYDVAPEQALKNAWDTFTGSFHTDNRYSNQTVSTYYETLDELGKVVNDKKNRMGTEAHKQTKEYKTQKGLQEMYGNRITELNKQVRGLPDGPDKDALKEEIAQLAGLAMDFYEQAMSGEIKEPILTATYANLPESVSNELIRLDGFAADYAFEPTGNASSKYTDPKDKKREYVMTGDDEAKDAFRTFYFNQYGEVMTEVMGKTRYQKANDQKKVEMLEEARDTVLERTKDDFFDWLAANRRSTLKK